MTHLYYGDEAVRTDPALRAQLAAMLQERRAAGRRRPDVKGHVVEFLKGGQHKCGVVRATRYRWLIVLDQDGKEDQLPPDKVLDLSQETLELGRPRSDIVGELRRIDERREDAKRSLDARTLWELIEQARKDEWTLAELADLYFADDPGPDGRAALSRALDDGHFFWRHARRFAALAPRVVQQHDRSAAHAARTERWLRAAASWLRSVADGAPASPPERADHAVALLEQKALFGAQGAHAHEAAELMKRAHLHGPHAAFDVLAKLGHWDRDENLDLLRHEVPTTFGAEALAEAERCEERPLRLRARRQWLGRVYGLSDGQGHCDRAVSIRRSLFGYTVAVHFASPALFVPPGGRIQGEAAERGASISLPERLVPMLPDAAAARARLSETERVPALTVKIRFSRRFEMRSYSVRLKRIRLARLVGPACPPERVASDRRLRKLHELARRLRQSRREAGAVIIPQPEIELAVTNKAVEVQRLDPDAPLSLIRSELAILANSLAGEFCATHAIPAIYRVEPPVQRILVGERHDPVACHQQKALMPKARLRVGPEPHHGLGVGRYAPVSRPLHRYSDFLMHQQLVGYLDHGRPLYASQELEGALLRTARAREVARTIEAGSQRYWLLKSLEPRCGQPLEAVVLARLSGGCLVELAGCLLKAFLPIRRGQRFSPGQEIQVLLTHVSARRDVLRLAALPS